MKNTLRKDFHNCQQASKNELISIPKNSAPLKENDNKTSDLY
jgi:hypothetical protein